MAVLLKTEKILGREVEIFVDDRGSFTGTVGQNTYYGKTLEELLPRLKTAVQRRRVKVQVPYSRMASEYSGYGKTRTHQKIVRHGVITGRHATSGDFLVREYGEADTLTRYESVLRPLSPDEVVEWARLTKAADEAQAALRKFEEGRKVDIYRAYEEAMAEAVAKLEAKEEAAS